ncbi:tetratricopeptide repeat protein [Stigmatella sp. ncwal1]|uniref:Tetratricopeptide repeat protein n=1 Tax=Stigmatella ashevillensis TaxID=2995309 RepID=A0ABT5D5L1_9BACT|nr:tetratricopeptide repeat protein [Stigmatella ashevillena]MDC0708138.1 tetratricopeptide repeat protein [Stigmatella ashevillena]
MSSRSRLLPLLALLAATACDDTPKISAKDRAEGLYVKGSTEYLQGQFDQALLSFNEMKQYAPADPRLPAAIGEIYLSMGKFEEALTSFEAALLVDPKRSTTWSRMGFIQAQLGKDEEARASLLKAVALYPQDFNALEQLGELHLKRREQEEAVRHFTLAAQASPDSLKPALLMRAVEVLQGNNQHAEALALLQKSTGQGIRSPEVLTALGDEQVRAGHLDEAATAYRDAATRSPKDPSLWELVGEIRLRQGKTDDAQAAFRESLRVKNRAIVHVSLARLHLARKDQKAAEEELALALESVSGSDVRELSELAELLITFGRKPDALRILGALAAEPDNAGEVPLQLRTARLARELKDTELLQAACARVTGKGGSGVSCP